MNKLKKLLKKQGFTLEILNGKGKGFTLVELIIVIAIIAVLAVAAFMMLTKWLGHSRDARKIGDVAIIKKALNISFVEKPIYPEPEAKTPIKDLNGNVLWYQGVFGTISSNGIDTLQKAPKNPTDNGYYLYSVTTDQKEYQIGVWLENGEEISFVSSVFAAGKQAYIEGEYDGYITYSSGTDGKIIKIPSLILYEGDTVDISGDNTNLMLPNKLEGESLEVKNVTFNPENVDNDKLINDIKTTFGIDDDKAAMLVIEDNSSITPSAIIYEACEGSLETVGSHSYNVSTISHGSSSTVTSEETESVDHGTKSWRVVFSCSGGEMTEGEETEVISCENDYINEGGVCELDDCGGTRPENSISNSLTTGYGNDWTYSHDTQGTCTYKCEDGFHTEDSGLSCVSDNKDTVCGGSPDTNATKQTGDTYPQTWDGSSWNSEISRGENQTYCDFDCNENYTWNGTSCEYDYFTSCKAILEDDDTLDSGTYTIDVDGNGGTEPFDVRCDMDTDGGGWTFLGTVHGGDAHHFNKAPDASDDYWTNASYLGTSANRFTADYKSKAWTHLDISSAEVMYIRRYSNVTRAKVKFDNTCQGGKSTFASIFVGWDTSIHCTTNHITVIEAPATTHGLNSSIYMEGSGGTNEIMTNNGWCWNGGDNAGNNFWGRAGYNQIGYTCMAAGHLGYMGVRNDGSSQYTFSDITGTNWVNGTTYSAASFSFLAR